MKKVVSLLLALMLLLGVVPVLAESGEEPIVLKVFYSAVDPYNGKWQWGSDPVTKYITERTGITLDITFAKSNDHQEFYGMLASDTLDYDLLYLGKLEPALIDEEYALPLNKLADEYFPEFYDYLPTGYAAIHAYDDGNIYYYAKSYADTERLATIPGGVKGWTSFTHNRVVREKLGNPSFDTLDDVKAAAILAKENGVEYPVFLTLNDTVYGNLNPIQIINTCFNGPGFVYPQENGVVTFNIKSDEYKKAARWINSLYREGLIQPDNFTFTWGANDENVKEIAQSNNAFIILGQDGKMNQHLTGNTIDPIYIQTDVATAEGISRDEIVMDNAAGSNIGTPAWYILDSTKNPAAAIKFVSMMWAEDIDAIKQFGIEGLNYTYDYTLSPDGVMITNEEMAEDLKVMESGDFQTKWGYTNSVIQSWSTRYSIQYTNRAHFSVEENGQTVHYGDRCIELFPKYCTAFKTGNLTIKFTDADDVLLLNNVLDAWFNDIPNIILAEDDAAFEAAFQQTIDDMERVGLAKLEEKMTEKYTFYVTSLGEVRNARWDVNLKK